MLCFLAPILTKWKLQIPQSEEIFVLLLTGFPLFTYLSRASSVNPMYNKEIVIGIRILTLK